MLCGALGIGPAQLMMLPRGRVRSMGAASRPYSINAAVWLAFVAVNGVCMHCGPVFEDSRNAACNCLRIVRIANGPKISMGHFLGAKKFNFVIRDIEYY